MTAGSSGAASTLQSTGTNALQSLIADTNTTSNGQYVFGGENSGVAPMADYFSSTTSAAKSAIDAAFQSTFGFAPTSASAANISASQMQSFISGTFANLFSGASWTSNWSSASSTDVTTQIAPGESATTSTNANQPGFQQLAEGYAMLAEFGGSSLSTATQQTVITAASSLINQGISSLTTTEATLGSAQTQRHRRDDLDVESIDDPADADRQSRQRRRQRGRRPAQFAADAARNRLRAHRATAEDEPCPISPHSDPGNADVRILLQ